jgi:hypothetical protein
MRLSEREDSKLVLQGSAAIYFAFCHVLQVHISN